MIKIIDKNTEIKFFPPSVFECRIFSLLYAYGTDTQIVRFWNNEDCIIAKMDSTVTICGDINNYEEVNEFLNYIGAKQVFLSGKNADKLKISNYNQCIVMEYKNFLNNKNDFLNYNITLREAYSVLEQSKEENFYPPPFEPFYLDMSHRIRHNSANVFGLKKYNKPVSCVFSAYTDKSALLFSGAVVPEFRNQNIFSELMKYTQYYYSDKKIFLCCERKLQKFYEYLGYKEIEKACIINL